MKPIAINPTTDLELRRIVPLRSDQIWQAWTDPTLMPEWFAPRPWRSKDFHIDLRPGGRFSSVMVSPEGEEFPNSGCLLEVVPNQRLVFTSCLSEDFRPVAEPFFTAVIELREVDGGTDYRALALHKDEEDCQTHADMGFESGWGACLDQIVELMRDR